MALKNKQVNSVMFSKITFHKLSWLEWLTIALALWFVFYPLPYRLALGLLLLMPLAGIVISGYNKPGIATLVHIKKDKKGLGKYDVAEFIDVAAWAILVRVYHDFSFESFYSLIIPGTITCAIILLILFRTHTLIEKSDRNKWWIYSSLIFNISLYSYAGTYALNCAYDDSKPVEYKTEIIDKSFHRGKRSINKYYLTIMPWGHHYDKESIRVSRLQYDEFKTGDSLKIKVRKGLFNIPWYAIDSKYPEYEL